MKNRVIYILVITYLILQGILNIIILKNVRGLLNEDSVPEQIENTIGTDSLEADTTKIDELESSLENENHTKKFNYVYPRFQVFNKAIDSSTVNKFIEVMDFYKLGEDQYRVEWYVGQILLESGGKQYYKNGKLVTSWAGAIGMCQIMPNTARHYFQSKIDYDDLVELRRLGITSYGFIDSDVLTKKQKKDLSAEWLSDEINNIILWGYITRDNLKRTGSFKKHLIAYNTGIGGMMNYIKRGGKLDKHKYIKGIRNQLGKADRVIKRRQKKVS